jgi:hypothetical protein
VDHCRLLENNTDTCTVYATQKQPPKPLRFGGLPELCDAALSGNAALVRTDHIIAGRLCSARGCCCLCSSSTDDRHQWYSVRVPVGQTPLHERSSLLATGCRSATSAMTACKANPPPAPQLPDQKTRGGGCACRRGMGCV